MTSKRRVKVEGIVDVDTALTMFSDVMYEGERGGPRETLVLRCEDCGHRVQLHYGGRPHFEHYPDKPPHCPPLSQEINRQ